jgi:hypothetical protein
LNLSPEKKEGSGTTRESGAHAKSPQQKRRQKEKDTFSSRANIYNLRGKHMTH